MQTERQYDLQAHCVASKTAAFGVINSSFKRQDGLLVETRTYPNGSTDIITYNQDGHVIKRKSRIANDNADDAEYTHPDKQNRARVTIHPKSHKDGTTQHTTQKQDFHPRSGKLTRAENEYGRVQSWCTEDEKSADFYVGNLTQHTDLAGQVIRYTLDFNKQVLREVGTIDDLANRAARGVANNNGTPPLPRDLQRLFDEAGHETDIIDNHAHITTRKRYDAEDYCTNYYFIGHDGRVYQATNTTYDELHRIHQICDTHMMLEFGYDKKNHRRYAKAAMIGEDGTMQECHRNSWYDYSPAGRVRLRDCVLDAYQIKLSEKQGMAVTYKDKDGRVDTQTTLTKDSKQCVVTPEYGVGSAIAGAVTTIDGVQTREDTRSTDAGDRMVKRLVEEKDKKVLETFTLDTDDSVLSQTTETTTTDKNGDWHKTTVTRTLKEKQDLKMVEEIKTIVMGVNDVRHVNLEVVDEVTTTYIAGDTLSPGSVATKRLSAELTGTGDKTGLVADDLAKLQVKEARVSARVNSNTMITGIGPDAPTDQNVFPDGYRSFVVNSEGCYLLKETNKGRNYYFYAQKRPGNTTLLAYFGDLPDQVAGLRAEYKPKETNIDVNHHSFSSNFPPPYPGKHVADGEQTYREIAEALGYGGYAEAIAWANNADASSKPIAGTVVTIPTLMSEVAETAESGSLPAIEMLLRSMYPVLAAPHISMKPPKINWGLIAAEMAVSAAAVVATGGLLAGPLAAALGATMGAVATGAAAGMAGSLASQGVAIGAGAQHGLDVRALATSTVAGAVGGGVAYKVGAALNGTAGVNGTLAKGANEAFTWGNVGRNVATAEAVAAAQQMALMATGLQSKPDWVGFGTAGFNSVAGSSISGKFGNGTAASSLYTGVTMAGDELIRDGRINATVMSASMVGSMVGELCGGSGAWVYREPAA